MTDYRSQKKSSFVPNSDAWQDPLGLAEVDPQVLTTAQRKMRAVQLAVAGWSHEMIGRVLGLSRKRVSGIVRAEVDRCERLALKGADRLRRLEEQRACEMLRCVWPGVLRGVPRAIEVALKVSESIRKLRGLDAPQKLESVVDMNVTSMSEVELRAEADRLGLAVPEVRLLPDKLPGEVTEAEVLPNVGEKEEVPLETNAEAGA